MKEIPSAYVGVSGVVSPEQQAALRASAAELEAVGRRLAIGVKAVHKTQWSDAENRFGPTWYPIGDAISTAVVSGSEQNEMRVAQVYLDVAEARERGIADYESRFIAKLMGRTGLWLTAVQFDLLQWHTTDYAELFGQIRESNPDAEIILQCQGPIMDTLSPLEIIHRLERYQGQVSHVLFDASHGTGTRLNPNALRPYVAEASAAAWIGAGVAGGLDESAVRGELQPLLRDFPNLSFDAEGKMHKTDSSDRSLDMRTVRDYLSAATEVIGAVR